ncbi:DNA topoisomerase [Paramarasmius palmivorus]|uniref:DNA topoisomerase n=1 Tax=Paramarasmius palmivorus TaxID=297713 RepID=A0AAW0DKM3_9AGAR
MRVLCVAEKPSIAKAITQILSGGQFQMRNTSINWIKNYDFNYPYTNSQFTVTAVAGHLTELDFTERHRKWHSCDPFELFDAPTEVCIRDDNKPVERNIFNEAKRADTLMIWTDCDREGEAIGAEIAAVARRARRQIVVKRARFNAIVSQQIHHAAQNPVNLDNRLVDAVESRILIDLKIGAAFTRYQTMRIKERLGLNENLFSYGFVVARFKDVQDFRPETFWYIYLAIITSDDKETPFTWRRGRLFSEPEALVLYEHVMANPRARVMKVTKKETKKWKPLPLTTVEMQKAGSRLLKLAPKKILDIAEKLYQQGFLSYPRTETDQFDPQFDFQSLIEKQRADPSWGQFATSLREGGFNTPRKGKNNDKAHPPIHPTAYAGNLHGDEKRVYEYITRRFLASCSKDAKGWQTVVEVVCGDEYFEATGLTVTEKNYLEVFPYDKWNDHELPDFEEGQEFDPSVCELREGQTTRPSLLTEADLVSLMDKNGIGTDATIAGHIQTIIDREYVIERYDGQTKYLLPSTLGLGLVEGYDQIDFSPSFSKPLLRRETERRMVDVVEGRKSKFDVINQSLEQYREMYVIARREFNKVVECLRQHFQAAGHQPGQGGEAGAAGRGRGGAQRGGRGGRGGGGGGGNGPPGGGGGSGGGGGGVAGASSGRGGNGRSRGRGGAPSSLADRRGSVIELDSGIDSSSESDFRPKPPSRTTRKPPSAAPPPPPRQTAPSSRTGPTSDIKRCYCNKTAIQKEVTGNSNSRGRLYWGCPDDTCELFEWINPPSPDNSLASTSRTAQNTRGQTSHLPEEQEPPQCDCSVPAAKRTVTKDNENKGRQFWTCGNERKCNFFRFVDDPEPKVPAKRTFSSVRPKYLYSLKAYLLSGTRPEQR